MDFPFPGFLPPEFGQNGPWWFSFYQTPDVPEYLIEGKEKGYLSWFIRGLEYNPSAITDADIDVFVSHAKAPGGLRSQFEHFRAFPLASIYSNNCSEVIGFFMKQPMLEWIYFS